MLRISVVLCTHDPRPDHLARTVAGLKAQTLDHASWELLIVDNASKVPVAVGCDLAWHVNGRHVVESALGLTAARLRGIAESTAPLILFVDDDNVLVPDYLAHAIRLMQEHHKLGVLGSARLVPEFEVPPAEELKPYLHMLALREIEKDHWSNDPQDRRVPWGAGMVVRREVAQRYAEEVRGSVLRRSLDRTGTTLNSGGDDDFSWMACAMGYGKGLFVDLHVTHLIAARRLQKEYLLRLAEGHAFSGALLLHIHGLSIPRYLEPGSPAEIFTWLVKLRPGRALLSYRTWREDQRKDPVRREFDAVWRKGVHRFSTTIPSAPE
jgi:glycosyltransferase involved in cell wall biosynthesis